MGWTGIEHLYGAARSKKMPILTKPEHSTRCLACGGGVSTEQEGARQKSAMKKNISSSWRPTRCIGAARRSAPRRAAGAADGRTHEGAGDGRAHEGGAGGTEGRASWVRRGVLEHHHPRRVHPGAPDRVYRCGALYSCQRGRVCRCGVLCSCHYGRVSLRCIVQLSTRRAAFWGVLA